MLPASISSNYATPYITFEQKGENGLEAIIDTENLQMRSISSDNKSDYMKLIGDAKNMELYNRGAYWIREGVENMMEKKAHLERWGNVIDEWEARWQKKNDPFSAFAVFKKDDDQFVGHASLTPDQAPGSAELSYIIDHRYWHQGLGTQTACAVVNHYAPSLIDKSVNKPVEGNIYQVESQNFETIIATAHVNNTYTQKILNKIGMKQVGQGEKHGHDRYLYSADVKALWCYC